MTQFHIKFPNANYRNTRTLFSIKNVIINLFNNNKETYQ